MRGRSDLLRDRAVLGDDLELLLKPGFERREQWFALSLSYLAPLLGALATDALLDFVKASDARIRIAGEPLVATGRVDAAGRLVGDAWNARPGLAEAGEALPVPPAPAPSPPPPAPQAAASMDDRARVRAVLAECEAIMAAAVKSVGVKDGIVQASMAAEAIWRRHFPDHRAPLDLSGAAFGGALFTGHGTPLNGANFRNANLDRARWLFINLRGADLTGASMRKATMAVFGVMECSFRDADLSGADITFLHTSDARPTDFTNANLSKAKLKFVGKLNLVLSGANMSGFVIETVSDGNPADAQKTIDGFRSLLSDAQKKQVRVKGGCFIATAACDDANAPEVVALKAFCEAVLRPRRSGRVLIALYEAWSPMAADWIRRSPLLRRLVRTWLVRPLAATVSRDAARRLSPTASCAPWRSPFHR